MGRDTERPRTMVNSFVWTAEEAKYLKAVLQWQDAPPNPEEERRMRVAAAEEAERSRQQVAGDFRVLVIGARGTGKTSILTRFGNGTFRGEGEPPDPFYERGCRHPIELDGQTYMVDALEMPSKHLLSNPMLEQALGITEAAVLIYDVRDPASLRLVEGIADFMRESISNTSSTSTSTGREYALMLVGNKSDVDDEERAVPWAQGSKAAAAIRIPSSLNLPVGNANSTAANGVGGATNGTTAGMSPIGMNLNGAGCAFLEVSAKTGDNVDKIFPAVAREIMRLKRLSQQRREQAERQARQQQAERAAAAAAAAGTVRKKLGLWKILSTPFFRRHQHQHQGGTVEATSAY